MAEHPKATGLVATWWHSHRLVAMVKSLTLKNLPEALHDRLAATAKRQRLSLNNEVILCREAGLRAAPRDWTHCLGAGGTALEGLGDLAAIEGLNLAGCCRGGPAGWMCSAVCATTRRGPSARCTTP
jgi:hypothetical protein